MSAPVREEESRTGTVGGGNGESGGDGETPFEREYKDYATGYASVPGLAYENMGWVTEVEGEIPKEMVGTLLRNGPAMYERDGFVKSYLDGDGMVTSIAIKDGKAYFRNKFVRTEHFDKEEELGRYTEPSIFTASDPRKPVRSLARPTEDWMARRQRTVLSSTAKAREHLSGRKKESAYSLLQCVASVGVCL